MVFSETTWPVELKFHMVNCGASVDIILGAPVDIAFGVFVDIICGASVD